MPTRRVRRAHRTCPALLPWCAWRTLQHFLPATEHKPIPIAHPTTSSPSTLERLL